MKHKATGAMSISSHARGCWMASVSRQVLAVCGNKVPNPSAMSLMLSGQGLTWGGLDMCLLRSALHSDMWRAIPSTDSESPS